ncbi:MAG: deoxyribose-phosphate aldolase [Planctomycetota bacterium]
MDWTVEDIARMIDHSLLAPPLTDEELRAGCRLAKEYDVASVCIKPYAVRLAAKELKGSGVAVGTVIGFPHGSHTTAMKVAESEEAMNNGAVELDMVVNIGKVRSGEWDYVHDDIASVVMAARRCKAIVKVIFENCFLDDEHKINLCKICTKVEAHFVKTSTGYGYIKSDSGYAYGGATDHDLKLMRKHSGPKVQVKAAGGVRDLDRLLQVRALGVTRVGATATKAILDEAKKRLSG